MNFNLFLIILIALLIIFCIILYNGIRILLVVGKEKGIVKYEFKVTILKIPIFKRTGSEGIIDIIRRKDQKEDSEKTKEDSESKDEISKTQKEDSEPKDKSSETQKESAKSKDETRDKKITDSEEKIAESEEGEDGEEEKSLGEKYKEIKPILNELKKAKKELKTFLKNILKAINLKRLEGHLIIGLSDHATTIKIASWIWSIGAIVNSKKPTLLTVEPRFTEIIVDFEGRIELKTFLKNILKAINLKKLEGHLIIGLSDHATTIKIASWIWSIGAIVNSKKPTLLTVEPRFTEIIVDFEGKIELKINLLLLLIYSLLLLTQKNIRELIKVLYREYRSQSKEEESIEKESVEEEEESIEKESLEEEEEEEEEHVEEPEELEKGEPVEEEEKDEKEEAVTQVKQLMKIIKSD